MGATLATKTPNPPREPLSNPVHLVLEFRLKSPPPRLWFVLWLDIVKRSREMPGCRGIRLEQDVTTHGDWRIVSDWESSETLALFWRRQGIAWMNHAFDDCSHLRRVTTIPILRDSLPAKPLQTLESLGLVRHKPRIL
jgi:quinol monooxygenase YgiN